MKGYLEKKNVVAFAFQLASLVDFNTVVLQRQSDSYGRKSAQSSLSSSQ